MVKRCLGGRLALGFSVLRKTHVEGLVLLLVLCSEEAGARCWFCYPAKELEWIQTLISWQGRGDSWLAVAELRWLEG